MCYHIVKALILNLYKEDSLQGPTCIFAVSVLLGSPKPFLVCVH